MKPIVAVIVAVIVIVVGVGAFFGGTAYGEAQAQNTRAEFFRNRGGGTGAGTAGAPGQNGQNGQGGQFGRPSAFGTMVTVTVDAQTAIQKTVSGTASDLQPGERVTVTSDQTGSSIVARSIQLRPATTQ